MRTKIFAAVLGVSMGLLGACNKDDNESINNSDREFMDRMSYTHNGEVEFGNLAASKGSDASVKAYGQAMASEHEAAMSELQALAKDRNYKLPSNPDAEHVALKIKLNSISGREFDSVYMKGQVKDHLQEKEITGDELSKGKDQVLKNYATKQQSKADAHKSTADGIVTVMGF